MFRTLRSVVGATGVEVVVGNEEANVAGLIEVLNGAMVFLVRVSKNEPSTNLGGGDIPLDNKPSFPVMGGKFKLTSSTLLVVSSAAFSIPSLTLSSFVMLLIV